MAETETKRLITDLKQRIKARPTEDRHPGAVGPIVDYIHHMKFAPTRVVREEGGAKGSSIW